VCYLYATFNIDVDRQTDSKFEIQHIHRPLIVGP